MKLYDSIGPNPRVVRIFAREKGIDLERIRIDIATGENRRLPYLAKNSLGTTPILELNDGTIVAEVTTICEYIEELYPTPAFIGATPEERAETRMWTRRIDIHIVQPMALGFRATEGRAFFNDRVTLVSSEAGAQLKGLAGEKLMWLNAAMQGKPFVCGDRFNFADIFLFVFLEFGAGVGQPLLSDASTLHDWFATMRLRPAMAQGGRAVR